MLQLTPQSRIFLAVHPVDFRKGIDGLAALCRHALGENPLGGAVYVFRNRTGTTLKLLAYDGPLGPSGFSISPSCCVMITRLPPSSGLRNTVLQPLPSLSSGV